MRVRPRRARAHKTAARAILPRSGSSPVRSSSAQAVTGRCRFRGLTERFNRSAFAVRCLPATHPGDFISLRAWDNEGSEREIGIMRHLERWPKRDQELALASLARRYFVRRITGIDEIKLEYGYLFFSVRTDQGPARFTMRCSQNQAQDFGARGKVLLDLESNRFLVADIEELPEPERDLFQRYVYW